ncbi:MAG: hypothetical protein ACR2QV_10720 [Gammaproteobacteria bacterium]
MIAATRFIALLLALLVIVGCNRGYKPKACLEPREYHEQRSLPPMSVPEDLEAPDPAGSVQIPALPAGKDGSIPGPCLEAPPDYFDTSPT